MTMCLLPDEGFESFYLSEIPVSVSDSGAQNSGRARNSRLPLIQSKLRAPSIKAAQVPERVTALLSRSVQNHSGTLIIGRAGAGKTTLAADYSVRIKNKAWYTIDAADADWAAFSRYFRSALSGRRAAGQPAVHPISPRELFADLNSATGPITLKWPSLLVLDGVHYLYDSDWFAEFFQLMIASIPPPAHVLVLARSKPTHPIWRMRSKQMLGVIDERVLSFTSAEAEELFAGNGLDRAEGAHAHRESYGQAGRLIGILESKLRVANGG